MQKNNIYKYDIAISYDRQNFLFVQNVVNFLRGGKWEIFFDVENQNEILSEDLKMKLYRVYQEESLVKVLFITKDYLKNDFTQLESRRAYEGSKDNIRKLIIVNCMGEELPEEYKRYAYLGNENYEDEIAYLIEERVKELKSEIEEREGLTGSDSKEIKMSMLNNVKNNSGIIAGNKASFQNIHFHK